MNEIVNMIYSENNLLLTMVNMFVFAFALDFVLSMCNILKSGARSTR